MKKILSPQLYFVIGLIAIAGLCRLLTNSFHIWNFTPITAMALFSGVQVRDKKFAFIIPLAAIILTDAIIGFYQGILVVYAALIVITAFGFFFQNKVRFLPVALATVGASCIFFIVTNFAFFYPTFLYPHNMEGVIAAYTAGIPFFKTALAGDLLYSALLFGAYELVIKKLPAFVRSQSNA